MWPSFQDLRGKILLKAKKIGTLEDSFRGIKEDAQTGEVSDEDEVAEIDEDNVHRDSVRRRVMVGQTWNQTVWSVRQAIKSSDKSGSAFQYGNGPFNTLSRLG